MESEETIRYQSNILYDLPTYKESMQGFTNSNTVSKITRIIVIVFLLFLFVSVCVFDLSNQLTFYTRYFLLFSGVYLLILAINWLRNRNGDIQYKRTLASNGGKPMSNSLFFMEDSIQALNNDTGNKVSYTYDQIIYIVETQNLLLLVMKYRLCLVVDKRTLVGGTKDDFAAFLLERCPNNRRKKPRSDKSGKIINYTFYTVIILGSLLCILNLPGIQLWARINGQITNDMSYQQIAQELESFGITCDDSKLLADLEEEYDSFQSTYHYSYDKVPYLLSYLGMGEYDPDTWEWTPGNSGVYWFDMEVFDVGSMYTDFLRGVSALGNGELDFTDIQEDFSRVDWEKCTGSVLVSFDWNGQHYIMEAEFAGDWFDPNILDTMNKLLTGNGNRKRLYFASDEGQGLLVFYRDESWAGDFEKKTGLNLEESCNALFP